MTRYVSRCAHPPQSFDKSKNNREQKKRSFVPHVRTTSEGRNKLWHESSSVLLLCELAQRHGMNLGALSGIRVSGQLDSKASSSYPCITTSRVVIRGKQRVNTRTNKRDPNVTRSCSRGHHKKKHVFSKYFHWQHDKNILNLRNTARKKVPPFVCTHCKLSCKLKIHRCKGREGIISPALKNYFFTILRFRRI